MEKLFEEKNRTMATTIIKTMLDRGLFTDEEDAKSKLKDTAWLTAQGYENVANVLSSETGMAACHHVFETQNLEQSV